MEFSYTLRPVSGTFDLEKILQFLDERPYACKDPRESFLMGYEHRYIIGKDGASLEVYRNWASKGEKFLLGGVVLLSSDKITFDQEFYSLKLLYKMRAIVKFVLALQDCIIEGHTGEDITAAVKKDVNVLFPVDEFEREKMAKKSREEN